MKITWAQIGQIVAILGVLGGVLSWVISLERRVSSAFEIVKRVKNIEDQLYPILVDHRVNAVLGGMLMPERFDNIDSPISWDDEG